MALGEKTTLTVSELKKPVVKPCCIIEISAKMPYGAITFVFMAELCYLFAFIAVHWDLLWLYYS